MEEAKRLISQGNVEPALKLLDEWLQTPGAPGKAQAYYLRGNAYRKQEDWQRALNNYQQAIDLDPQSPALHARKMLLEILEFYHKDMYNQ